MPGRPPWSQAGTDKGGQTVAVNNRTEKTHLDVSQTGSVAAGADEIIEVYAPSGSNYRVVDLLLLVTADGNATAGSHSIFLRTAGSFNSGGIGSNYTDKIHWGKNSSISATNDLSPANDGDFAEMCRSLWATDENPLQIEYSNDMDVAQDNKRRIELVVEEVTY